MAKEIKRIMADEVRTELANSDDLFVIGILNLDAASNHELRNNLRDQGARLRVIHNRTSTFALDEARKEIAEFFTGQTALALSDGSQEFIPVAKTLVDAAKKKTIEVRGGYIDGELLDMAGVVALAKAPDKLTLRAMLLAAINGSARGIAATLNGVGEGIARCLQARIDLQPAEEEPAEAPAAEEPAAEEPAAEAPAAEEPAAEEPAAEEPAAEEPAAEEPAADQGESGEKDS